MKNNTKKNEITKAAYELFIKNGYDDTSVDEIISAVGIAKGTFYYYFETKEDLLEEVIGLILKQEQENALAVLGSDMPVGQKIMGVIAAMRPTSSEAGIATALNRPENAVMHDKINEKIIDILTPILASVVRGGIESGVFDCDNIEDRVRLIMIISSRMFDGEDYSESAVAVFIDTVEKILGAQKGSMDFIRELIKR